MGSAIGAFSQGIQNTLGKKLEEKHQEEEQRRQEQRELMLSIWHNPEMSKANRQLAFDQLQKLSNSESKKGLAKIAPQLDPGTREPLECLRIKKVWAEREVFKECSAQVKTVTLDVPKPERDSTREKRERGERIFHR